MLLDKMFSTNVVTFPFKVISDIQEQFCSVISSRHNPKHSKACSDSTAVLKTDRCDWHTGGM